MKFDEIIDSLLKEELAVLPPPAPPTDTIDRFDGEGDDDIRYIMVTVYTRALPQVIEMYSSIGEMSDEECFEALKDTHESMIIDELQHMYDEDEITSKQFDRALEYIENPDKRLFDISFNDLEY
jgi:hypothetical protein